MKAPICLLIFIYTTVAAAGGYQGCLEKIWAYQAYLIDEINPPAARTIGFKCNNWSRVEKRCIGNDWVECTGARGGRCTFDNWIHFLGNSPTPIGWRVPADGQLDVEETAKRCVDRFEHRGGTHHAVPNPAPYRIAKSGAEYNRYIKQIGDTVNDVAKAGGRNDDNKHLWEDFDNVREKISIARAGDHGPFLIRAARESLGGIMAIRTQDLGTNPANGNRWETMDWKETARQARADGMDGAEVRREIETFLKDYYRPVTAKSHVQVIKSYKRVADRANSCRRRGT